MCPWQHQPVHFCSAMHQTLSAIECPQVPFINKAAGHFPRSHGHPLPSLAGPDSSPLARGPTDLIVERGAAGAASGFRAVRDTGGQGKAEPHGGRLFAAQFWAGRRKRLITSWQQREEGLLPSASLSQGPFPQSPQPTRRSKFISLRPKQVFVPRTRQSRCDKPPEPQRRAHALQVGLGRRSPPPLESQGPRGPRQGSAAPRSYL